MKGETTYEELINSGIKTDEGWYSEDHGFLKFEEVEEFKKIQACLLMAGFDVTLIEAEYFWCSWCTMEWCATWVGFDQKVLAPDQIIYAKKYFK